MKVVRGLLCGSVRLVLVAVFLLLVTSCELFFLTPFPSYLNQLLIERDISETVPVDALAEHTLGFVGRESGNESIVYLHVESPTTGTRLHFYTESLSYLGSVIDDPTDNSDQLGTTAIYDPAGYIYMGDRAIDIDGDLSNDTSNPIRLDNDLGYYDSDPSNVKPVVTISRNTATIALTEYPSLGGASTQIGTPTIDSTAMVERLAGVHQDFEDGSVVLIFDNGGGEGETNLFYSVVLSDYGLFAALPDPIFGGGGSLTPIEIRVPDFDGGVEDFVYTRRGFVAETDDDTLTVYDLDGEEVSVLNEEFDNSELVFHIDGESYFIYDTAQSILRKVETWW